MAKGLRKHSVPCHYRAELWMALSGGDRLLRVKRGVFERVLAEYRESLAGGEGGAGNGAAKPGSEYDPEGHLCLTDEGVGVFHEVLGCVSMVHPEVRWFSPWLPPMVGLFLHWMPAEHAFWAISALIREPSPLMGARIDSWTMLLVGGPGAHPACRAG